MKKRDKLRFQHMLEAVTDIEGLMQNRTDVDLAEDRSLQLAVAMALSIIGEAANHISEETQQEHADLPWRQMVGMRNWLVHAYWRIDYEQVWLTILHDLPSLHEKLEKLLEQETLDDDPENTL